MPSRIAAPALEHVCPRPHLDVVRVAAVLERTLRRASAAHEPARALEPSHA